MDTFENKKIYSEKNQVVFICPVCRKTIKGVINAGFELEVPVKPIYYNDNKFAPLIECPFCEKKGYFNTAPDMISCDAEMVDIINALLDKGYSYINESFNGGYMKTLIKGSSFFTDDNKDPYFDNFTTVQYPNVNIDMEESIRVLFYYYQKNYKDLNKEEVKTILKFLNEIYPDRLEDPNENDLINEVDNITEDNSWIFASEIVEFIYDIFSEISKLEYDTSYEEFNGQPLLTSKEDCEFIVVSLYGYDEDDSNMKLHITSDKYSVTKVEGTDKKKISYAEGRKNILEFIKNKLPNMYSLTEMIELYNRVKSYKETHKEED